MRRLLSCSLIVVISVCAGTLGCGPKGPRVVPVSGTLTRNGKPVPNLEIYFIPNQGRNSVASTDEQGRFNLGYTADQAGAQTGNHTVWVTYNPADPVLNPPPPDKDAIIAKYGSQEVSKLKVEVKEAISDLELKID